MENTCRGYMIGSTGQYIRRTYDEATARRMLGAVAPAVREVLSSVDVNSWYPVAHLGELFRQIALHHQETDGKPEEALERVGRAIATSAMRSFLRLLMKLMTPELFARKASAFWARDNRCGRLQAELVGESRRRMKVVQEGVGSFEYIGGVAPGFIAAALEATGCRNVRFTTDWNFAQPAPDTFQYELRWD